MKSRQFVSVGRVGVVLVLVVFCLSLFACGDKEPEERKAFAAFLEKHAEAGTIVPQVSQEEEKSLGRYAAHVDIIVSFNKFMHETLQKDLKDFMAITSAKPLDELAQNKQRLSRSLNALNGVMKSLSARLASAEKSKAELKIPEDVRLAYEAAYDKGVSKLAAITHEAFAATRDGIAAVLALLEFVEKNKESIEINGQMIEIRDEKLQKPLAELLDAVREKQQAAADAIAKLNALRDK